MQWLEQPAVKWAVPIPMLLLMAPLVWWFFRSTWRQLDADALAVRRELAERGEIDYRPMVALTLIAMVLTFHEYYGRPDFYNRVVHGVLDRWQKAHPGSVIDMKRYDELYRRLWWGLTRIAGYFVPLLVWPLFFRRDRLADFGLRVRGFGAHAWIYALCVVVMVPVLMLVARQPDFADYYPMYKLAGRSSSGSPGRWRSPCWPRRCAAPGPSSPRSSASGASARRDRRPGGRRATASSPRYPRRHRWLRSHRS